MNDFPNPFNDLANNMGNQGNAFNKPISDKELYYAFLSKADQDWKTGLWDVMFEIIPYEWAVNAFGIGSEDVHIIAPVGPASLYHLPAVAQTDLLNALGLKNTDDLAEGSWFLLNIRKQESGPVNGMMYDPDLDMEPET